MSCFGYLHLNINLYSVLCFTVCSAAIHISGESDLLLEGDAPLTLTCVNDLNSDVDFRFNSKLIGTCYKVFGCNSKDPNFTLSANTSSALYTYSLHTVSNFNTIHCGTYRCTDIDNINLHDSVSVAYKGFDNTSFTVDENNVSFSITTSCTFHAAMQDMTVSWFYIDNSSLPRTDLSTEDGFNKTNECTNYKCDTSQAKSFTFGLHFKDRPERFHMALIEVKVVYSQYLYKPLVWRSLKMYPVKDVISANSEKQSSYTRLFIGIFTPAVVIVVAVVLLLILRKRTDNRKERVGEVITPITDNGHVSTTNEYEERSNGPDINLSMCGEGSNAHTSSINKCKEEFVDSKSSTSACGIDFGVRQQTTNECGYESIVASLSKKRVRGRFQRS
ncbi:uncharacterized protein LOC128234121 isoform X1 [Mya arenaria]|uniref:uncharacterized protein LOC128234121 isoform X1 n=1 Tax=Mya arenaria TaxID=6604 RepID=UPI0022E76F49|nr:uncharacterized protein LOC128234121 isoform X1 [Mya arenaria]XP_052804109.1 uncharacterized protein LOC128234121 isoform X1 [Mya arenaria]XP_052804110.1 uncharacterized protein LOC128234121 isoform X1 [Mya arenaria]